MTLVEKIIARHTDLRLLIATTGTLGIEIARANLPDVILMDIDLPDINGITALKILHEDPVTTNIPVIAVSASAMPADIKEGIKAGFFHCVTKPINVRDFMAALDMAFHFSEQKSSGETLRRCHFHDKFIRYRLQTLHHSDDIFREKVILPEKHSICIYLKSLLPFINGAAPYFILKYSIVAPTPMEKTKNGLLCK
ncbi:MAG TPA: hypothetical protein DCW68_02035 [Rhodospirillaceae bacterium]|nr:MAG: hypothetical protein A2018_05000 [Alphaproteobacteria bacterium GWF2_58_20]HAU28874.1 hypothetical protein [Rhodospirillaceae bacterium]